MSLRSAVQAAVESAVGVARTGGFMPTVTWSFVSKDIATYNPRTDSYNTDTTEEDLQVLPYADIDDDDKMAFSSRGNFVESPVQVDTVRVLMLPVDANGNTPSVNDHFVWDEQKFTITNFENVFGIVYLMRARRV